MYLGLLRLLRLLLVNQVLVGVAASTALSIWATSITTLQLLLMTRPRLLRCGHVILENFRRRITQMIWRVMNDGCMLCGHLLRPNVANPKDRGLNRRHPRYPVHQRVAVAWVAIRGRHRRTVHVCQSVLESVIEDQTWWLLLLLIVAPFYKGGATSRCDRIATAPFFPRL